MSEEIRVLAVRQPWAALMVEGLKTIELRSRGTNVLEKVTIYASKTEYPEEIRSNILANFLYLRHANLISSSEFKTVCDCMDSGNQTTGAILGTVEIYYSYDNASWYDIDQRVQHHLVPPGLSRKITKGNGAMWYLKNPLKFSHPVPLEKWPSGGSWARIPKSMLKEVTNI